MQPNLALFQQLMARPMQQPARAADTTATSTSSDLTPLQRFAGGALYSTYTPYQGDPKGYGYGPQHRYFPTTAAQGTGTGTGTGESEAERIRRNEEEAQWQSVKGGPDSGASASSNTGPVDRSHHGQSFDEMSPTDLLGYAGSRERNSVMGMSLPSLIAGALGMKGANFLEDSQLSAALNNAGLGAMNPGDYTGGVVAGAANTGMNSMGGIANPELAGRSDATQAGPQVNVDPNSDPNTASKGRIVTPRNVKPGGKEDGSIQVTVGEGILNKGAMKKVGSRNFKALNAGKFDRALLDSAVDAAIAKASR